jgi:hypothetical protein
LGIGSWFSFLRLRYIRDWQVEGRKLLMNNLILTDRNHGHLFWWEIATGGLLYLREKRVKAPSISVDE